MAACAEGEEPEGMIGIAGSNSNGDAGTFSNGGSASGASGSGGAGSPSNAGSFSSSGTFSNAGSSLGGTTFGMSGRGSGGAMSGAGGAMAGSGGAAAGAGGKQAGGSGGAAAGAGGKQAGGSGGGGSGPVGACPAKNTWTATASVEAMDCANPDSAYCGPPARAIDDIADNRYTTGKARDGSEWLQIDFKVPTTVKSLTLNTAPGSGDYTLAYAVRMSNDENDIANTTAIVTGTGQQGATVITFPAAKTGRYLRINQTMAMAGWWSVAEMSVVCE